MCRTRKAVKEDKNKNINNRINRNYTNSRSHNYIILNLANKPKFELKSISIQKTDTTITINIKGYNNTRLPEIPIKLIFSDGTSYSIKAKAVNKKS